MIHSQTSQRIFRAAENKRQYIINFWICHMPEFSFSLLPFALWFIGLSVALKWAYGSAFLVFIGVVGETIADLTDWIKDEHLSKKIEKASALLLILGLAGDLVSIGLGQTEIAGLNRETAQLRKDAAQLHKEAEVEHSARVKIEASVAWRRLSKEQQSTIADHLKHCAEMKVGVSYMGGDPESQQFAEDIAAALRAANCKVPPMEPFTLFGRFGGGVYPMHPLTGVNLVRTTNRSNRDVEDAIQSELCSMGFDATVIGKLDPGIDVLVVGRPNAPQGQTKLIINAKTRNCAASP